jgi:Abnormal spindle-like microcephaly-assoc'd, ASPM-SPD-2-Hydin
MRKTLLVCLTLVFLLVSSAVFPTVAKAELSASPTSLSFGQVLVNTKSRALTVVLSNENRHPVSIDHIYSSIPEFIVISPSLPIEVAAHGTISFQVAFAPNSLSSFSGQIFASIGEREGGTYTVSIPVHGEAKSSSPAPSAVLSGSASSLTFGNTLVGTSTSQTVSLTNSGTTSLTISRAAISGPGFTLSGFSDAVALAAGKSLTFTVRFAPTSAGIVTGSLSVLSNAVNASASISLSGTGVQPQISVVPSSISFANVSVGVTNTQSLTIKNTGTANLTVSQASLAGSSFGMSGMTMPMSIAPGGSSTVTVTFRPSSASNFYANLSLVNNSPATPLVVPLSGTSVASVLQLSASPVSLSFGSHSTGTRTTETVTLTNTGNSSVAISGIAVSGTGFSPTSSTLPLTLVAGQSTSFGLVFTPTTAGNLSGTATVTSDASNSPLIIAMTGTGAATSYTVALNWTPSSSSFAGFNVYRSSQSGGPYTRVNSALVTTAAFGDTTVSAGETYYYVATEVNDAEAESGYSSQVSAVIP